MRRIAPPRAVTAPTWAMGRLVPRRLPARRRVVREASSRGERRSVLRSRVASDGGGSDASARRRPHGARRRARDYRRDASRLRTSTRSVSYSTLGVRASPASHAARASSPRKTGANRPARKDASNTLRATCAYRAESKRRARIRGSERMTRARARAPGRASEDRGFPRSARRGAASRDHLLEPPERRSRRA